MQAKHQQATNKLVMITEVGKQLPTGEEGKKDELWLEVQKQQVKQILKNNGPEVLIKKGTPCGIPFLFNTYHILAVEEAALDVCYDDTLVGLGDKNSC